jgi:small subunit ribosomal protein S10
MAKATDKGAAAPKVRIILKSFDHSLIDESAKIIVEAAERGGAIVAGPVPLPVKIKRFTVNKSTFVNKTAREQFELRNHKRLIDLSEATPKTIESLSSLHLPSGVEISIQMK